MNGIQGLMQQAQPQGQPQMPGQAPQMPGQAPMPGMMPGMQPQQRGPTPGIDAQTPMLKQLDLQQLKQLYAQAMMPGAPTNISPYAILSAISEKAKQEKAMRAVQSAAVQGQNAQQQNAGSIAQQVMQEADQMQQPVMARHGGVMQGYAGGGIVAFQSGTSEEGLPSPATSYGMPSDDYGYRRPTMSPQRDLVDEDEEEKRRREQEALIAELTAQIGPIAQSRARYPTAAAQPEPQPMPQSKPEPKPEPAPAVETSGIAQGPEAMVGIQPSGIAQVPPETPTQAPPGLPPALKEAYERRIANAALSPEQLKLQQEKQAEEMRVRRSILEAAEKRAGAAETRAREDYETEKAGIPQMYSPEFFFRLAGGISTKRGEELGSAGKAVAGFMADKRKAETAARKDYRAAQDAADRMRAASETIRLATAERDSAIASRNIDQARAAQDKIDQAGLDFEKAKYDRDQAAAKAILDERRVKADEDRAKAAQQAAEAAERRAAAYENRPEPTSDLNRAYQIEYEALKADGAPDTPATRRKAMDLAMDKLSRGAAGLRARTGQLTAANKEFTERAMSDQSLRGLRGQDRIDALEKLRRDVEKKYDVAPDAPDPTPSSAAPTAKPAPAAAATPPVTPIAMPAKESELKDGVVYETRRGPARWDAKQKQFFAVQ